MSQGELSSEERIAYANYKRERNERKAQHHDESGQTLKLVRHTLSLLILLGLAGISIYAIEKLEAKSDKLAQRSIDNHFYRTVSFELSANNDFEKSAAKLCYFIGESKGRRSEYAKKAHELGALITASRLVNGCNGDCVNLANNK